VQLITIQFTAHPTGHVHPRLGRYVRNAGRIRLQRLPFPSVLPRHAIQQVTSFQQMWIQFNSYMTYCVLKYTLGFGQTEHSNRRLRNESFVPGYRYRIGGRHKPPTAYTMHKPPFASSLQDRPVRQPAEFFPGQTATVTACTCGYNIGLRSSNQVLRTRGRTQRVN